MKIHQVQAATNWALLNTLGLNIFRGLGFYLSKIVKEWSRENSPKLNGKCY